MVFDGYLLCLSLYHVFQRHFSVRVLNSNKNCYILYFQNSAALYNDWTDSSSVHRDLQYTNAALHCRNLKQQGQHFFSANLLKPHLCPAENHMGFYRGESRNVMGICTQRSSPYLHGVRHKKNAVNKLRLLIDGFP